MKIVVIGGTGLIGSKAVERLRKLGHEAVAAAPQTGVNTLTGEGLAEALAGARVVIDVANSPSFDDAPALAFFQAAGRNLMAAEREAGVAHHIALSVVGVDRLQSVGYFRAKLVQEELIERSTVPYTILRSTQFFPFIAGIVQSSSLGETVHLSSALVQPISADDVAEALVEIAMGPPVNDVVEIAGPEAIRMDTFASEYLSAKEDPRQIVVDENALYFGARLNDRTLTPGEHPRLGKITLGEWLRETMSAD